MIENQDELRSALDKNRKLKEQNKQLEANSSTPDVPQSGSDAQLQTKVRMVSGPFYVLRSSFTHDRGNVRIDF